MNILAISYDYPPYKGGVANVSYQIIHHLNNFGENIVVVAQKTKGDVAFDRNNKFLTYRCINIFLLRELALILLLPYLAIKHNIDIIYMLIWHQGGIATFFTSKLLNIPYVLHAYGEEFVDYKKTLLDKIKYNILREKYKKAIFKNAKRVIAISNYTKDIVIESGVEKDKVDVVYPGVDIDRFKPGLDTNTIILRHNLYGKRILLTVATLAEHKGHDIIIKFMPQLLEKIPNLVYLIIGGGKNKKFLESLVKKLNLKEKVIFAGWQNESLPLYYNACDVYIMLSQERKDKGQFEAFGLVYLEANSCCKPVIGTKIAGAVEAVADGKTGYLIRPGDDQELINRITLLFQNKDIANKLGEEGRNGIIRKNLTWGTTARNIYVILASQVKK